MVIDLEKNMNIHARDKLIKNIYAKAEDNLGNSEKSSENNNNYY